MSKKNLLAKWKRIKASEKVEKQDAGIVKSDRSEFSLSSGQQRLYFLQNVYPGHPLYHYTELYHFQGSVELKKLIEAIVPIVDRHEILRTTYHITENGLLAKRHSQMPPEIHSVKKDLDGTYDLEEIQRIIREDAVKPFDLGIGPLFRISIVEISKEDIFVALTMHHIITDKWSMQIFRNEWAANYESKLNNRTILTPPLGLQYGDFVDWQLQKTWDSESVRFWRNKLAQTSPIVLPVDRSRKNLSSHFGAYLEFHISQETTQKIRVLTREMAVTPFVFFLSCFSLLLHKYSGSKNFAIGTPVTDRELPELEQLIGFFNNTISLCFEVSSELSVKEWIRKVHQIVIESFRHNRIPFETVVSELHPDRSDLSNPFFNTMFLFHKVPELPEFSEGVSITQHTVDLGVSKFDLTLYIAEENEQFTAIFEYANDLFEEITIQRFHQHYHNLITDVLMDPESTIRSLEIIEQAEYPPITPLEFDLSNRTVFHELDKFSRVTTPAIFFENHMLTHAEFASKVDRVARNLIQFGIHEGDRVGIHMNPSLELPIILYGVLRAGGAYVPLDPSYPESRTTYIVKDAGIRVVIHDNSLSGNHLPADQRFHSEDLIRREVSFEIQVPKLNPDQLAYIIYTSGSTGQPKGVGITHGNLYYSTIARVQYYGSAPIRFLLLSSFAFDSSVAGLFWPLIVGGSLTIVKKRAEQDINRLQQIIQQHRITHTLLLPSLYQTIIQLSDPGYLRSLVGVIVAGESCNMQVIENHNNQLRGKTALYNEYGPTEATVWSTVGRIDQTTNLVSIGSSIPGTELFILDDDLNSVPMNVVGELYISGPGLSPGYVGLHHEANDNFVEVEKARSPGIQNRRSSCFEI